MSHPHEPSSGGRLGSCAHAFVHVCSLLGIPALLVAAYFLPRFPVLLEAPLCAVRGFLGVACPGCGLTHAFIALAHGRIRGSVDAHPLGIVIALWLLYMLGRRIAALAIGRRPPELLTQRSRDWCLGAFLAALFSQWIFHLVMG